MKLELKHLAPYLPYELNLSREQKSIPDSVFKMKGLTKDIVLKDNQGVSVVDIIKCKPILRPLSDLTQVAKGECLTYAERLGWNLDTINNYSQPKGLGDWLCMCVYAESSLIDTQLMFEWHFDVFGLIEKGLAININTIK